MDSQLEHALNPPLPCVQVELGHFRFMTCFLVHFYFSSNVISLADTLSVSVFGDKNAHCRVHDSVSMR